MKIEILQRQWNGIPLQKMSHKCWHHWHPGWGSMPRDSFLPASHSFPSTNKKNKVENCWFFWKVGITSHLQNSIWPSSTRKKTCKGRPRVVPQWPTASPEKSMMDFISVQDFTSQSKIHHLVLPSFQTFVRSCCDGFFDFFLQHVFYLDLRSSSLKREDKMFGESGWKSSIENIPTTLFWNTPPLQHSYRLLKTNFDTTLLTPWVPTWSSSSLGFKTCAARNRFQDYVPDSFCLASFSTIL